MSLLSIADLQNIACVDKWMFSHLPITDLPAVVKEILFARHRRELTKNILSISLRGYFRLDKCSILSMRSSQVVQLHEQAYKKFEKHDTRLLTEEECISVCKSQSTFLIQQLLSSEKFQHLPSHVVTEMFRTLAKDGPIISFKSIMRSNRFIHIHKQCLSDVFSSVRGTRQQEIIVTLMLSPRFQEITIEAISLALLNASIEGDANTIFYLISSPRFKYVPIDMLGNALQLTCKHEHSDALQTILTSSHSDRIPDAKITAALIEAERTENEMILELLIDRYPLLELERGCVVC